MLKNFFFSKKLVFPFFCSNGHEECKFDNNVENFLTESWKVFAQGPKSMKKNRILPKWLFFFKLVLWRRRMQFYQRCPVILEKSWQFLLIVRNKEKNADFVAKSFFLKIISLWTCKMQFFQYCWKVMAICRKKFGQCPIVLKKKNLSKRLFSLFFS